MKWNHILVEGYCARLWEYEKCHSEYITYYSRTQDSNSEWEKQKEYNPNYNPNVKKPKRPSYCEKRICSACIPCDHLAFCDVDDDLRKRFNNLFHDYCDEKDREEEGGLK